MLQVADDLRATLDNAVPMLNTITDAEASHPRATGKWSRKEILGHLIDSACNNQQKFVRLMENPRFDFVGYRQDHWVASQKYNSADWDTLIAFWLFYNLHLARVIENTDPGLLGNSITIDGHGSFTLQFVMEDYVEHMKHHLLQILPDGPFSNKFQNLYNT